MKKLIFFLLPVLLIACYTINKPQIKYRCIDGIGCFSFYDSLEVREKTDTGWVTYFIK